MTKELERISELEQRILALTADKQELQNLNADLNKQLAEVNQEKEELELELRLTKLKIPPRSIKPILTKSELEKNALIIFLLITLSGALLLK